MFSILRMMVPPTRKAPREFYARLMVYSVMLVLFLLSFNSNADAPSIQILDRVDAAFKPLQNTWYSAIRGYAERLFWLLVLVDFGWTGVIYVLEKNDIAEIVTSLVKKTFTIGFFWGLLKFSDSWIPAIINSFRQIGTTVGKVSSVTPDGIASTGFELAKGAFVIMRNLGTFDAIVVVFPVTLVAIVTFLAFLFVAAQLLVTLVESYIAVGGGVILLGFGGSRWTTDFATKYLQYSVGTGLKLMIIYLIVGTGQTLFDSLMLDPNNLIETTLAAMGSALVYAYLAIQVPQIASSMMSGSPSMTAGSLAGTAITLGAAIAGAGAATAASAASAGAGGVGAAAGATGLAKALGAGYNSALDVGKTGMDAGIHAVGEVAKHGLGLAAGTVGDAVNQGKTAFAEQVDGSTGGKIAGGIEATRGGSMSGTTSSGNGGESPVAQSAAPTGGNSSGGSAVSSSTNGSTPAQQSPSSSSSAPSSATAGAASGSAPTSSSNGAPPSQVGNSSSSSSSSGAVPPPTQASTNNLGDASNASVSGGSDGGSGNSDGGRRDPLHERVQALQGYVPQDMAQGAAIQIDLKHTAD